MTITINIGTRASALALKQAEMVRDALQAAHAGLTCVLVPMTTTGDQIQDRSLNNAGGKGLFTKEIEDALLDGRVDIAVHSMKDMPTVLPDGLIIPAVLPRADVRDAFFSRHGGGFFDLPAGAVIGTASLRRQAILKAMRPDIDITLLRGNVQTRLAKLQSGVVDATILAVAGLSRLDILDKAQAIFSVDDMLPAVAQGAIGIECRAGDTRIEALLAAINCHETLLAITAERAFLHTVDGSCRTPIAGLAVRDAAGRMTLQTLIAAPDGSSVRRESGAADVADLADADALGRAVGKLYL